MNLILERHSYSPLGTFGRLFANGSIFHTVERQWLGNKRNVSCIPEGTYTVLPYSSAKYQNVWELQDVPGRSKILIHVANYPDEVEGCIGLGLRFNGKGVLSSRDAIQEFGELMHGVDCITIKVTQIKALY